jgi:hypothetical protein
MKQQINEIRRMQQLAGLIKESQLNEAEDIALFLNQHKDEVFEKIVQPTLNNYIEDGEIDPEELTGVNKNWKFIEKDEDAYSPYEHAELTIQTANTNNGFHASFIPFPEDADVDYPAETIIGGKKIHFFEYSF